MRLQVLSLFWNNHFCQDSPFNYFQYEETGVWLTWMVQTSHSRLSSILASKWEPLVKVTLQLVINLSPDNKFPGLPPAYFNKTIFHSLHPTISMSSGRTEQSFSNKDESDLCLNSVSQCIRSAHNRQSSAATHDIIALSACVCTHVCTKTRKYVTRQTIKSSGG